MIEFVDAVKVANLLTSPTLCDADVNGRLTDGTVLALGEVVF